ncbi:proton-conducting transporter transmembrane domain-containing protein [Sulfitobacter sp.]|uniref:proton-conducting transporter transmembrane domain-containing protein n=1 Tax=Sulfitobacter sp. TaxID=1903071 RepID=UPI003001DEE0
MAIAWIVLIFPLALMVAGAIRLRETIMPATPPQWAERAALVGFGLAAYAALHVIMFGPTTSPVLGLGQIGFEVLLDAVSVILLLLTAILAWVILRFSATYLQGEEREGHFTFWLCVTLAGIVLLVSAGNLVQLGLGWLATGIGAKRLLIFYPNRPGAKRAARKKLLFARSADVALAAGLMLVYAAYGTISIPDINAAARAGDIPVTALFAALCLAAAAVLQSALLPVHGWLTDGRETPTPALALLHSGVVSMGGFLLIRFADMMLGAPFIMAILVIVGGLSALAGSVVMLTQSATKATLAWSTVSQMGFIILQCGLGLFPLALLHIVAHAVYKTHALLTSAGAGLVTRPAGQTGNIIHSSPYKFALGMAISLTIYALVVLPLGLVENSPQAVALGAILVFGIGCLVAQGLADAAPRALVFEIARASVLFATSYLTFQWVAQKLAAGTLPPTPQAGPLEWMLITLALVSFTAVTVLQALLPHWANHPAVREMHVHTTNGFYLNALIDCFASNWRTNPRSKEI